MGAAVCLSMCGRWLPRMAAIRARRRRAGQLQQREDLITVPVSAIRDGHAHARAAHGRPTTRRTSSPSLSVICPAPGSRADPPFWTPAGVGLALRRARLNGVLCRAAGSAVCSLDGQPPGASIRGAFEAVAADPRERGYGLPCCCFGLAFFGLGGRAGRGADAEPGPRDGAVADRVGQRPGEGIVIMPPATRLPLCTQIALFCLACLHRPRHRAGCVSCWLQDREKS